MIRRFRGWLHLPPPVKSERVEIMKKYLANQHDITDDEFTQLGLKSFGFSSADLENAVIEAISIYLRNVKKAKYFRAVKVDAEEKFEPCCSRDKACIKMNCDEVPDNKLYQKKVSYKKMAFVLGIWKPTVSPDDVIEMRRFEQQHPMVSNTLEEGI